MNAARITLRLASAAEVRTRSRDYGHNPLRCRRGSERNVRIDFASVTEPRAQASGSVPENV
jgi:hypothetical protein